MSYVYITMHMAICDVPEIEIDAGDAARLPISTPVIIVQLRLYILRPVDFMPAGHLDNPIRRFRCHPGDTYDINGHQLAGLISSAECSIRALQYDLVQMTRLKFPTGYKRESRL